MGNKVYKCQYCGLFYADFHIWKKCERYCKKNNSSDIEIIKKAIVCPEI